MVFIVKAVLTGVKECPDEIRRLVLEQPLSGCYESLCSEILEVFTCLKAGRFILSWKGLYKLIMIQINYIYMLPTVTKCSLYGLSLQIYQISGDICFNRKMHSFMLALPRPLYSYRYLS